jgi:hypothetical protein
VQKLTAKIRKEGGRDFSELLTAENVALYSLWWNISLQ